LRGGEKNKKEDRILGTCGRKNEEERSFKR